MRLPRAELSKNSNRQRLAARGFAEALRGLFFSLSCAQNRPARSPSVDAVSEQFQFPRYEKVFVNFGHRNGGSGRNGWLRPGKEAGGAGEGRADRFAFLPSGLS